MELPGNTCHLGPTMSSQILRRIRTSNCSLGNLPLGYSCPTGTRRDDEDYHDPGNLTKISILPKISGPDLRPSTTSKVNVIFGFLKWLAHKCQMIQKEQKRKEERRK